MKKRVWLTMLDKDEPRAQRLYQTVTQYGMEADGHFWVDDLEKMAWSGPLQTMSESGTGMWLIAGQNDSLARPETLYGLSMLALALQGRRDLGLPIVVHIPQSDEPLILPTPLAGAELLDQEAGLGPKLTARVHMPVPEKELEYRLTVHPLPGLGQWMELGPPPGREWAGAMLGLDQGQITAHGVGPAGRVPQKTILEYQMQGMTLESGDQKYTAWAVHNALSASDSYYVQVQGMPRSLLFGPLPEADTAELYRLQLV
ncbi:MAG: hypothetical protein R6U55_00275 [Desulfovermiculus sp.]